MHPEQIAAVTATAMETLKDFPEVTFGIHCHNDETIMAGLNMMSREQVLRGSNRGPILIPGNPGASLLYQATLLPANESHSMPARILRQPHGATYVREEVLHECAQR